MGPLSGRGIRADVRMGGLRCFQLSCPRPGPEDVEWRLGFECTLMRLIWDHGLSLYVIFFCEVAR